MAGVRFVDIWVNCPDAAVARAIAEECVAARLAACANILSPIDSIYRWQGKVEQEREVPLVLKARAADFAAVAALVRTEHPFEVPSIVAMPIEAVEETYAAWLEEETRREG